MRSMLWIGLALSMTSGCSYTQAPWAGAQPRSGEFVTVVGSATWDLPMAMPSGSTMTVRIDDISFADGASRNLAQRREDISGLKSPRPFRIDVDRNALNASTLNTLSIRLEDHDGKLLWITDTVRPVRNAGSVDMGAVPLVPVGASSR